MPEQRNGSRHELMGPYEHPYRYALRRTWRQDREPRIAAGLVVALVVTGEVGALSGADGLGALVGVALLPAIVVMLWVAAVARMVLRETREWDSPTELSEVRARRWHAGSKDPVLAHDEFAVTVEDDGHLVTWRFRPLRVSERATEDEFELPGRPRYAVSPVDEVPFATNDTARAAEQLVAAQTRAADREAAAVAAERAAVEARLVGAELELETRSTAAALRRATGQRPS